MEYHVRHWWLSLAYHILAKATDEGPSDTPAEVGYCLSHLCGLSPSQCGTKRRHFDCVCLCIIVAPRAPVLKEILRSAGGIAMVAAGAVCMRELRKRGQLPSLAPPLTQVRQQAVYL